MARTSLTYYYLTVVVLIIVSLVGCSSSTKESAEKSNSVSSRKTSKNKSVSIAKRTDKPTPTVRRIEGSAPRSHNPKPLPLSFSTKKLSGYQTAAEYLSINSRYLAKAIAAVCLPIEYENNPYKRYPLVIAFGGAGECARPPKQGALAWIDYYKTDEAVKALKNNHLISSNLRGLATKRELQDFNERLQENPYQGVILVCPYSPPLRIGNGLEDEAYENFVMKELIPALKTSYRVDDDRIGVDGVSMGGARSMYYGFKYPKILRTVGSVQAAVGPFMDIYENLVRKNKELLKHRPIQLVTSDKDPMKNSVYRMHNLLKSFRIPHTFYLLTGPHDYIFNQGPGAIALLMFHDRALRSAKRGPTK